MKSTVGVNGITQGPMPKKCERIKKLSRSKQIYIPIYIYKYITFNTS